MSFAGGDALGHSETPRQGLVGKISALEMGLEETSIQPLTRNLDQQILGALELATAVNFSSQPLDQRAEFPRFDLLL